MSEGKSLHLTNVFILSEGCYSDCRNIGVFTSREKAEQRARACSEEYQIEEFILDNNEHLPDHHKSFSVTMRKDGEVIRVLQNGTYNPARDAHYRGPKFEGMYPSGNGIFHGTYEFYMMALHETHAVKIANERRAQMIALNLWKEPTTQKNSDKTGLLPDLPEEPTCEQCPCGGPKEDCDICV